MNFTKFESHLLQDLLLSDENTPAELQVEHISLKPSLFNQKSIESLKLISTVSKDKNPLKCLQVDSLLVTNSRFLKTQMQRLKLRFAEISLSHFHESCFDLATFTNIKLNRTDFRNSRFLNSHFKNIELSDCDLSYAEFKSCHIENSPQIFTNSILSNSIFIGCQFINMDLTESGSLSLNRYIHCQFINCNLRSDQRGYLENENSVVMRKTQKQTEPASASQKEHSDFGTSAPEKEDLPLKTLKKPGRFDAIELQNFTEKEPKHV